MTTMYPRRLGLRDHAIKVREADSLRDYPESIKRVWREQIEALRQLREDATLDDLVTALRSKS